uniref:Leucine-rich repeat-containing N-terminal plant-type domain-containing protein n=1 Tax=Kalanchoe fedtschenkoi TaxID=63787 RepID=A0A7N0TVD9_KALFE
MRPEALSFVFLLISISSVRALTVSSDVKALQAFKAAVKPSTIPSYSCLGSWDFATDPCALPRRTHFTCGLSCSQDATRVTAIVLDSVRYSGALTPTLSWLRNLTTLDLADNEFYGQIPSAIFTLPNLQSLTLRSNAFSGPIHPSVANMKSLQVLDLSRNSLTGPLPGSMSSLISLHRLDLSFNKLTGTLPKSLPASLSELAVRSNLLTGYLAESTFKGMARLEVVELSANAFSGTLPAWFFQLPAIQQVNLSNNTFTGIEVSKPNADSSDLIAVDLSFNQIQGYLPVNFTAYPYLSSLSLRYNRFRGPVPLEFSKKQTLRRLFLDGNFLNGKPPNGFFSNQAPVAGSLADNCLQSCPASSRLCSPAQKPTAVCRQAYGGKPKQKPRP